MSKPKTIHNESASFKKGYRIQNGRICYSGPYCHGCPTQGPNLDLGAGRGPFSALNDPRSVLHLQVQVQDRTRFPGRHLGLASQVPYTYLSAKREVLENPAVLVPGPKPGSRPGFRTWLEVQGPRSWGTMYCKLKEIHASLCLSSRHYLYLSSPFSPCPSFLLCLSSRCPPHLCPSFP